MMSNPEIEGPRYMCLINLTQDERYIKYIMFYYIKSFNKQ